MRLHMKLSMRAKDRWLGVVSPVVLLVLWEVAARLEWIDARFFPAPSAIFEKLVALTARASCGSIFGRVSSVCSGAHCWVEFRHWESAF